MQTGAFEGPTKVAVSERGDIAVVDQQQMAVQTFSFAGDYVSMFKVMGVQSVDYITTDKLAVTTHRGVDIYTTNGQILKELSAARGLVTGVRAYKFGFIACTLSSVLIYKQSLLLAKEIIARSTPNRHPWNFFKRPQAFVGLQDVAVTTSNHIVVLEKGSGFVHVLDNDGYLKHTINPSREACGKLKNPQAIAVDKSNNVLVADTGNQRVLQFNNNGAFAKCLLNFAVHGVNKVQLYPQGVSVTQHGHIVVVVTGRDVAQVRIYATDCCSTATVNL